VFRPPEVTLGLWLTTAALCLVVVVSGVGITGAASRRRQTKGEPTAA